MGGVPEQEHIMGVLWVYADAKGVADLRAAGVNGGPGEGGES